MTMTFYQQQVEKIREVVYSKEYLCEKAVHSKNFIGEHYAEPLTLADIINSAFISRFHFIRIFKQYYGVTPWQYLISVRIDNAKQLLQSGKTVSDTCFLVGFDSVTSFTGLFKKMTGSTPYAYQKQTLLAMIDAKN